MYKKIMLGLILLLLLPVGHAVTSQECQNTSYLQINTTKTIEIDGNSSLVESWEEIYCSEGCDYTGEPVNQFLQVCPLRYISSLVLLVSH